MLFLLQVQELLQTPQLSASRWGGTRFSTLISKSILSYLACGKHLLTLRYFWETRLWSLCIYNMEL